MIRPMQESDLARVRVLAEQLGYPVDEAELRKRFEALTGLFVAVEENEVVGWTHVRRVLTLTNGGAAEITALVVDETIRGRGIGKKLVRFVENWAAAEGLETIVVRSQIKRERAHHFYLTQGYALKKTSLQFQKLLESPRD